MTLRSDHVYASVHSSLLATTCDYGLTQLVTEPTRLDNTLIYFTDHPSQITDINILPDNIVMVTADIKLKFIAQQPPRKIFLYHKANWDAIRQNLIVFANDFPQLLIENANVECLWTIFRDTLLNLMARYIPCKTTSKRQHLPWVTNYIRKLIKKRDTQYKIYKTSRSIEAYNNFKDLKHCIQAEMRTSYWRYINTLILPPDDENQPLSCQKKFWSYIYKNIRRDRVGITSLQSDGNPVTDSLGKAELLNKQFKSVSLLNQQVTFQTRVPIPTLLCRTLPLLHKA